MAISLTDLQVDNKTFDMELGAGKKLTITYDPNLITSNMLTDMNLGVAETCKILSELILDWDLVDDDKKPIKPTEEFFNSLKIIVMNKILTAIFDDAFPKAESTQSSGITRRRGQR